jgi:hypothetical protein
MMKLIDDIGFDNSFSFIFSPRPGTPAANLHDDTPHDVKLRRLQELQAVIERSNIKHQRKPRGHGAAHSGRTARRAGIDVTITELMGAHRPETDARPWRGCWP